MNPINTKVGLRIKSLRKKEGLTQEGLGMRINEKQSRLGNYEAGIRAIPISILDEISKEFNVSLSWLVGEDSCDFLICDQTSQAALRKEHLNQLGVSNDIVEIKISEDGMMPEYRPDDVTYVDRSKSTLENLVDGFYAIEFQGKNLVRKIRREINGTFSIISLNSEHKNLTLSAEEFKDLTVIGKVVANLRWYD